MRASRLVALLLLLQLKGRATAEELAQELEVSVRTVYRDIEHLSGAGVPVYAERGVHGGYRLVEGYRTTLTGFTTEEAGALLLTGAPAPATELGLGALMVSTRLKLLAALPEGLRAAATRADERFHLDPSGWKHAPPREHPQLRAIAAATWQDRRLRIVHSRAGRPPFTRTVDPLGVVHKTGSWYLVAAHRGTPRVYRADRIAHATILGDISRRPTDFDLVRFWESWQREYSQDLPRFVAEVRVGPAAQRYRDSIGQTSPREAELLEPFADGWQRQRWVFDDEGVAAAAVLALAPQIEVLAPASLRHRLAAVAGEIVDRHAGLRDLNARHQR